MKKFSKLLLALGGISAVGAGLAVGIVNNNVKAAEPVKATATNGEKRFTLLFDSTSYWPNANAIVKATYKDGGAVTITKDADLDTDATNSSYNSVVLGGTTYRALSMVVDISTFTYGNFSFDRINPSDGTTWNSSGWVLSPSNIKNGSDNTIKFSGDNSGNQTFTNYGLYYKMSLHTGLSLGTVSSSLVYGGSDYAPADPTAIDGYDFKGWYTNSALTTAYTSTTPTSDYNLYAKYEMNATGYATDFLSKTGTECAAGAVSSSNWSYLQTEYLALSSTNQSAITSADALVSGTPIQQCAARYDEIMKKYTAYHDFADRSTGHAAAIVSSHGDSSSTVVLGGLAAIAVLAAGGYFFVRKKKNA